MHKVFSSLLFFLLLLAATDSDAKSKKEWHRYWQEKRLTDTPVQMDLTKFLPLWFEAHSCQRGIHEDYSFICELGRDKKYTYFTYKYYYGKRGHLDIKVPNTDLKKANFGNWYACNITDSFFNMSVPEEHLRMLFSSSSSTIKHSFSYIEKTNSIQYRFHLKISGMPRIANRKTCANYSFDDGSFSGLE